MSVLHYMLYLTLVYPFFFLECSKLLTESFFLQQYAPYD